MLGDITVADGIYVICGYTDMRKSIDGLCAVVKDQLNMNPSRPNAIYLFCGRRSDRIKVLLHEREGFVLLYKRLDANVGKYRWPRNRNEVKAHKKARKSKAAYDEVFADLPTENVYVDTLTEEQKTCDVCGTMMIPIGHELIRTELRYTEPKLERIDYYATTYECPQCKETEDPRFIKDEGTPALIPGSYASSGLAAHVMYYKYVMSMPLYRQEQQSAGGTALLLLGSHTTLLAAGNTQRPRKGLYTSGSPGIPIL